MLIKFDKNMRVSKMMSYTLIGNCLRQKVPRVSLLSTGRMSIRGRKTISLTLLPLVIRHSMTCLRNCLHIILVPLHRPILPFRLRIVNTGVLIFRRSSWTGRPLNCIALRTSDVYRCSPIRHLIVKKDLGI
jgi:hypothetical protein